MVHVDPLSARSVDVDTLKFAFRKQGGVLVPQVMRQYLDTDFTQTPKRVILISEDLDINHIDRPEEYADDRKCDLFDEEKPVLPPYGQTYVASGQRFDLESFKGGELVIEDYHGEALPVGKYLMYLWEPHFHLVDSEVAIHEGEKKVTRTFLTRDTVPLELNVTGARPSGRAILEGRETHYRVEFPLDFATSKEQPDVPADAYTASTSIPGLDGWRRSADLLPATAPPSVPDLLSKLKEPKPPAGAEEAQKESQKEVEAVDPYRLTVKTRLGLAGRIELLSRPLDPLAGDTFIDRGLLRVLNLSLYGHEERPEEGKGSGFLRTFFRSWWPFGRAQSDTAGANAVSSASGKGPAKAPSHPDLLWDQDKLRQLLAERLDLIDLLVLDARDIAELQRSPEVAAIVERYVEGGGSLFAFVSRNGDYGQLLGAPLSIEKASRKTRRFALTAGTVKGIVPAFDKKKVKVKSKRALPEIADFPTNGIGPWRVLAFTEGFKEPRIIERGARTEGGYVALWLDDPASFHGPFGGTVPKVEEARRNVEDRVLDWSRYLMYRRYDKTGHQRQRLEGVLWR